MNSKRAQLSQQYHAALQTQLKGPPGAGLELARELGREAVSLGMETLDMARIHEIAFATIVVAGDSVLTNGVLLGRAGLFFAESITPIESTHRGAIEANISLNQIVRSLGQRTRELADSNRELKQEIARRQVVEESLKASEASAGVLLQKSLQMQEELRHLSRQLLSVQEEERRKISRELHDVIAQTLTSINIQLATLKNEVATDGQSFQRKIASTQRLVEESVDIVHRFARELRPTVLDDLGLIPALQTFIKSFSDDTGVQVSLRAFAGIEQLDSPRRTALFRITQEALTNVARHSKATRAEVSIRSIKGTIRMEISDNGEGFEVDGTTSAKKTIRLGLLGMKERTEMIGGTFCVESAPGAHTTIRVEIQPTDKSGRSGSKKTSSRTQELKCQ